MKKLCDDLLEQRNIKGEWNHVKANQDEKKNKKKDKDGKDTPLTQAALMNIDCYNWADELYNYPDETQQSTALINPIEVM